MTSHIEHELSIPEELLLLVLDDESGGGRSDLALGGGVLAELVFRGVVVVEQHGRTNEVVVAGANAAIDHELLAECLEDVRASSKQRNAAHWVNKFSTKKDLKARVATPLVERGVLDERKRKLLFFEFTQYPETNPVPEAELTERLRSAIEHDHITPDARTTALLTIANASGLLTKNLDRAMLRRRRDRLKELAEGDQIAGAVKAAIEAVTTAIVVAATAGGASSS